MIIDTHSHYEDEAFDLDRDELLRSMESNGVGLVVNIGSTMAASEQTVLLTKQFENVYGAVGVHPSNIRELNVEKLSRLRELAAQDKIVMIGEIGLDYYWDKDNTEQQKYWFRQQLLLALDMELPVSIHSRDAAQDTYDMLNNIQKEAEAKEQKLRGILHCYSYGPEMAERFCRLGFYFGIGGVVTFKNAKKLKEAVKMLPMDRLLLETDCPYLAPVPHRSERNSSLFLPLVVREIAEIKGMTEEEVIAATEQNARQLLRLPA